MNQQIAKIKEAHEIADVILDLVEANKHIEEIYNNRYNEWEIRIFMIKSVFKYANKIPQKCGEKYTKAAINSGAQLVDLLNAIKGIIGCYLNGKVTQ